MPIAQILFTQGGGGSPSAYATFGASPTEGYSTDITLYAENWNNTTIYWTVVGKGSPSADTNTDMSGTLSGSWNPGFGTNSTIVTTISFAADTTTEGTEYWGVDLGTSPGASDIWAGSDWPISDISISAPADFTIEWWQKVDNGGGSSPRPWAIGLYPTQQLAISYESKTSDYFWINNSYVNATTQDHRGQGWRHIAYVRNNGVLKGYINGTQYTGNITSTQLITGTNIPLYVGTGESSAGNFNGYITNLHIIKGVAKYTDNFTPSATPLQLASGSVFLLPATNINSKFYNIAETAIASETGSVTWNSDTPFTTTAGPYTQFTNTSGQSGGGIYVVSFTGVNYNTDLLNVKTGWAITNGVISGTVIGDAVENTSGTIDIPIDFDASGTNNWTFTQPPPGGSLYFDGSSYLNFGASVDWAMDA